MDSPETKPAATGPRRTSRELAVKPESPANELVIVRTFDAPVELVWKAWTEPERMMRWWGPRAFTVPVCKIDLRVGGRFHLCMRSPDGKDYWTTGVYREIVQFKRIVATDSFSDSGGNIVPAAQYGMPADIPLEMLLTVTFEAVAGKTKMTTRQTGMPAGLMGEMASAGWNESFDKLAESLRNDRSDRVAR